VRRDVIKDESRRWREGAAVMCDGRLFHRRVAAMGNALSPTVDRQADSGQWDCRCNLWLHCT